MLPLVNARTKRLSATEWEQWCATATNLPVTCRPQWAHAVANAYAPTLQPVAALVNQDDGMTLVVAYETPTRIGRRLSLSPFGLYAAAATGDDSRDPHRGLKAFVEEFRLHVRSIELVEPFYWAVPGVELLGMDRRPAGSTHVLRLDRPYEELFQRAFSGATRTCIRRAEQEQVQVIYARDAASIGAYYEMHESLAKQKGGYGTLHPRSLFESLLSGDSGAQLGLAYVGGELAAGGVFLNDGPSVFYWHAAADRRFARQQPAYALLSDAIKHAIARHRTHFNFGGSAGIASLVKFKESWGAVETPLYSRLVEHPLITRARRVRDVVRATRRRLTS